MSLSFNLGGNGGQGGWAWSDQKALGGSSYDTSLSSVELRLGSGGGGGSAGGSGNEGGYGGAGGSSIRLFAADTIKINGSILSNGRNGEDCTDSGSTW